MYNVIYGQDQPKPDIKDARAPLPPVLMHLPLLLFSFLLPICSPSPTVRDDSLLVLPKRASLQQGNRVGFSRGTWDPGSHEILCPHTKSLLKLPHFVVNNLAVFRRN